MPAYAPDNIAFTTIQGYILNLSAPINNIKVIYSENDTENITEFVIRLINDEVAPTLNTYFYDGVFFQELNNPSPLFPTIIASYSNPSATIGYTDTYGNFIPAGIIPANNNTVLSGTLPQTITLPMDGINYFGAIQGFWQTPAPNNLGIQFGTDGYIRTIGATVGQYIFYPGLRVEEILL